MKWVVLSFVLFFASISSASVKVLTWEGLLPNLPKFEDPFLALSPEQLYDLATIAQYQQKSSLGENEQQDHDHLMVKLAKDDIDVDYLFEKLNEVKQHRQLLATQPNPTLNNQDISLAGFITPLEFNGEKIVKFFLVPSAGACIHTPPPPPNQIVIVDFPKGIDLSSQHQPFVIEGKMQIEKLNQKVGYIDGSSMIDANYRMTAKNVKKYQ